MKKLILVPVIAALSFACTKKKDKEAEQAISNTVVISAVGETMNYDVTEITVKHGEKITLTMKNPSTTLMHNWVLTQPGKDTEVAIEGIKAGEANDYVPKHSAIIAHTKMIPVKGEETITFTAPPPGDYPYICTFPGHYTIMKGVLHSK